jgi:cytochrome c-type biogenesis protein
MVSEIPVAFAGGLLSFFAPCVLPLVPGYLSAVSAVEATRLGERGLAPKIVLSSLPFVAGFTSVFVVLGVGAQLLGDTLLGNQFVVQEVAGFVMVVFGLAFMGLLPWPERLVGARLVRGARGRGSRVLLGGAFAVCAAPCVGPVLTGILLLAGNADTAAQGAVLLAAYSFGLAVPLVLAGAMFTRVMGAFRWVRDHFLVLQVLGGAIMVAVGLLLVFDRFYLIATYIDRVLEWLGLGGV